MKKLICRILGHKMYRIKPFYNLMTGWAYDYAIEEERCTRCGSSSNDDLLTKLNNRE